MLLAISSSLSIFSSCLFAYSILRGCLQKIHQQSEDLLKTPSDMSIIEYR